MPVLLAPPVPTAGATRTPASVGGVEEAGSSGDRRKPLDLAELVEALAGGRDGGASGCRRKPLDLDELVESHAGGKLDDESKLKWLASQVVGAAAEFDSPFGRRRITYCDHTASGRFLQFIEDILMTEVLPFYG